MRIRLKFLLLLLIPIVALAQQPVVKITPAMFDTTTDAQLLSKTDGWLFHKGNDTAWAHTDIDVSSWQKLQPALLSAGYADKNGRLECWFRIKIKPGSAFGKNVLGIDGNTWAAVDYYVDGKLVLALGNNGESGKAFEGFLTTRGQEAAIILKPGVTYTIAIHFVDYLAPLPPRELRSEHDGMSSLIGLTGPKHDNIAAATYTKTTVLLVVLISVCGILSLLSGFMAVQNPFEKTLRVIAFSTACLTLALFCGTVQLFFAGLSFNVRLFLQQMVSFLFTLSIVMAAIIIPLIFKRKLTAFVKIFVSACIITVIPINFLPSNIGTITSTIIFLVIFGICVYYVVSSWKTLKGAQWAIVTGLLISIGNLLLIALFEEYLVHHTVLALVAAASFVLSFPLSLIFYIAMRFKEILAEVQLNAARVLQLSEEKKEEALNRQRVLEEEVSRQTAEIRSNQARLVQSEKMASLGELTAGIAHEIQNPLNFVNNFSEVSIELLQELKEEEESGNKEEVIAIAGDLTKNLEKIHHHGRRADFIVKGMLEHSRTNTGEKQLTDTNVLCDEFLKLSFHGLRAKDKSFNAEMITHFDTNLPKINVSQQDMGRVMLNLFNNAFYAVNQKMKTAGPTYKPTVELRTSLKGGAIEIVVEDNGSGIPDAIKDKIMQPFFTTKPTGEGTGLGLSLSYDIVVKGHGGAIKINTKEGEFTEFIITLPFSR